MNIIFAGTPDFALPTLKALLSSGHHVIAVYTQPDRKAGRGQQLKASPVKLIAEQYGIPIYQPVSLRDQATQDVLRSMMPDIIVVVAYGLLLPQAVLDIPHFGCVNVHPSLLPRWRGAAPIQRTILAGDRYTGVATMQLDTGMDTGPILLQERSEVEPLETSRQLHDRLAVQGAHLLLKTLRELEQGTLVATPQSIAGVTHAAKITKTEAEIDWYQSALKLQQCICGYNPIPVAYTTYHQQILRVWEAQCVSDESVNELPGKIIHASKKGIDVATGKGVLRLFKIQLPGKKIMSAQAFMNKEQHAIQSAVLGGDEVESC